MKKTEKETLRIFKVKVKVVKNRIFLSFRNFGVKIRVF